MEAMESKCSTLMGKYCILFAGGGALATAGVGAASSSRGGGGGTPCFVSVPSKDSYHRTNLSNTRLCKDVAFMRSNTMRLHASDDESSTIDPSDIYNDLSNLPSPPSSSWGVGDDWSSLSNNPAATSPNTFVSSSPGYDAMEEAARILEEQNDIMSEWGAETSDSDDASSPNKSDSSSTYIKDSVDGFVEDAIEIIASNMDYNEPEGVQLYDTKSSISSPPTKNSSADSKLGQSNEFDEDEMAFMIRCNQSPEQFLISQGRALPELTEEMKYSPKFLLQQASAVDDSEEKGDLPLQPKATPFLKEAVQKIFDTYAVEVEELHTCRYVEEEGKISRRVLDREALAKWMTTCISSPLTDSRKSYSIGPHDQSISAILGRYSQSHGSGRLTLEEFQALYLEVAWAGYIRDIIQKTEIVGQDCRPANNQPPSPNMGVIMQGRKNTEKILKQASLALVWRDLEAHEIFSPAEEERIELLLEMERLQSTIAKETTPNKHSQMLMDECVLFEDYEERLSHQISYSDDNDNDMLGVERSWDFLKDRKREKSSHELVEMTMDGTTPKRIRDGQFVFIDEESCIGCTQVCPV